MHVICLMECHPDHKKKIIEDVSKLTYKVTDNSEHEIENRIQIRELSLIDLVVQEKALDDILEKISPYIENADNGSQKLKTKVEKLSKYLCLFGGLEKIKKLPLCLGGGNENKGITANPIIKERGWAQGKILPLGTMPDKKNEQGLDRL